MKYERIRRQGLPQNFDRTQTLTLHITTNESWDFYALYDLLAPKQKRIWRCLVNWTKNYPNSFPSQTTIAKKCKCGRQHVNRTIALFKTYGWVSLFSRGVRRSKVVSIPTSLRQIDVYNRQYFRRVETTTAATYNYCNYKRSTSRAGELKKEPLVVPKLAQKLGYSEASGRKLALVPEYILEETLYQCKKLGKMGFKPESEERYFVGTAIKMAQDKGCKLDWRRYYA